MPDITITISVHVPEGSTVSIVPAVRPEVAPLLPIDNRSVAGPVNWRAFDLCPTHHLPWKFVPAGVSQRTGKPYNAFHSCPEQGCKQRPPQGWRSATDAILHEPVDEGPEPVPF